MSGTRYSLTNHLSARISSAGHQHTRTPSTYLFTSLANGKLVGLAERNMGGVKINTITAKGVFAGGKYGCTKTWLSTV